MVFAFRANVEMLLHTALDWTVPQLGHLEEAGPETLRLTILSFLGAGVTSWTSASPRLGFKYRRSLALVFMNIP